MSFKAPSNPHHSVVCDLQEGLKVLINIDIDANSATDDCQGSLQLRWLWAVVIFPPFWGLYLPAECLSRCSLGGNQISIS